MNTESTERDPVELLAEEFIERHRRGESPCIDEYVAAHPELSDEIADLFPMLAALEKCKPTETLATPATAARPFACPEQLGDLRLVREIGRGGMGIVYEAFQQSIGRRVAVKVLPQQVFFTNKMLSRFQREAQAAGALNHPNIVTVYSVGEQDGLHYLVMPLIEGVGLDLLIETLRNRDDITEPNDSHATLAQQFAKAITHDAFSNINKLATPAGPPKKVADHRSDPTIGFSDTHPVDEEPSRNPPAFETRSLIAPPEVTTASEAMITNKSYWKSVARIISQAASAIAHAHNAGTLHRDIKPANLLVDRTGNAWVTDFGLAKALEQEDFSRTGEVVGTLRYMAPEQLGGEADRRSDIYSLGLTLYELLCLRPAFGGKTPSELIREITMSPPAAPRKINPAVPHDLETITLKAMAAAPEDRYQTADEFADDLQNFLHQRPLLATRTGKIKRHLLWRRRNPLLARLTTAVILLSLTTAIGLAAFLNAPRPDRRDDPQRPRSQNGELDRRPPGSRFFPDRNATPPRPPAPRDRNRPPRHQAAPPQRPLPPTI